MAAGTIQTYAVMHDRVPIFADTEMSRLTAGATTYLVRGTTFSGQATNKNNTTWLADGSGFISAEAYIVGVAQATYPTARRRLLANASTWSSRTTTSARSRPSSTTATNHTPMRSTRCPSTRN
jgi:hypothetical protein